jgi:hypothetical protein
MQFKTIALATAFALTSSLAFAQSSGAGAIGSDDLGNLGMINRGPDGPSSMYRGSPGPIPRQHRLAVHPGRGKRHARRPDAS